jgi:hypothetical protein
MAITTTVISIRFMVADLTGITIMGTGMGTTVTGTGIAMTATGTAIGMTAMGTASSNKNPVV